MKVAKFLIGIVTVTVGVVSLTVLLLLVAGIRLTWQLHFWVPEGHAIALGEWHFDDYEFQVWQRKTQYIFEPFADGLFVRRGTNEWEVFCFDIQDNYLPKVELRKVGDTVEVFRNSECRGVFDMSNATFRGAPDTPVVTPVGIGSASEPPGQWWLR